MEWPRTAQQLVAAQKELARAESEPWTMPGKGPTIGGCFVCFGRGDEGPGAAGDEGWAGAALMRTERLVGTATAVGTAGAGYEPGLLALREGPLLEDAVRGLPRLPDVLLVDATGRDHPRRAGLALHLGAVLGVATVGVTHRPLLADGAWPGPERDDVAPLRLHGEVVGYWLRTRAGYRPLAVHPAWRTDPIQAVAVVEAATRHVRTPEPLRQARRVAREARTAATS